MTAGKLDGRVALVTGGSRGIGAAIVAAFAAEGAEVFFCHDGDAPGAIEVVRSALEQGGRAAATECDVSDPAAARSFFEEVEQRSGGVDILVNNAGIGGEVPFADITLEMFDRMLAVNLRSLFHLAQLAAPGMRRRRWGRIINVASQLAYKGAPGLVHYCAAKAGVVGLTRALALELVGDGVLVNAIAPGLISTRLTDDLTPEWIARKLSQLPLARMGEAREVAPTAVLLASAGGDYYVGQTLSPNGGDVFL